MKSEFFCLIILNSYSYYLLLMYAYFLLMFFNCCSMIYFWFLLEINMVIFISMMSLSNNYGENLDIFNKNFLYLVVQTLGSLIFIFFVLLNFNFKWYYSDLMLTLAISLKIGMFPFHFWLFNVCGFLGFLSMTLMLCTQKIPHLIVFYNMNIELIFFFILVNLMAGSIMLAYSKSLEFLIISSSIMNIFWLVLFFLFNMYMFIFFFMNYFFFTLLVCMEKIKSNVSHFLMKNNLFIVLILMVFNALPPLSLFFFKLYLLEMFSKSFSFMFFFFLILSTLISIFSYFKFFFKEIMNTKTVYKSLKTSYYLIIITLLSSLGLLMT